MTSGTCRIGSGVTEPVPRLLQQVLRQAVLDHVTHQQRRVHSSVLHVGVPGRRTVRFEMAPGDRLDPSLSTDVIEAMLRPSLERKVVPLVWLTRREHETQVTSEDHHWANAARAAGGELGLDLDLVVVTRRGWHDPRTGVCRSWKRMRAR